MSEKTGMQVDVSAEMKTPVVHEQNLPVQFEGVWGSENLDIQDVLISKVLCGQGMSKAVAEEKAKQGDLYDSVTGEIFGGKDKPLDVIAFHSLGKFWIIYQEVDGKLKYMRQEPVTAMNNDWPLEDVVNGIKIRRDKALNFYALLPSEIERGEYMPKLLSFRRTSYTAGRKLLTIFARLKMFKKPPASRIVTLSTRQEKNDKGIFYVMDVAESGNSTEAQKKACWDWFQVINTANVRVDNSDLEEEGVAPASTVDSATVGTRAF